MAIVFQQGMTGNIYAKRAESSALMGRAFRALSKRRGARTVHAGQNRATVRTGAVSFETCSST